MVSNNVIASGFLASAVLITVCHNYLFSKSEMARTNSWSLSQVDIENFKAINNATVIMSPGFSVITGPNGSGKSCLLESIGFGLGASPAELRVTNLSELCGNACPGQRVRVNLKFSNGSICLMIGSSLVDGVRLYLVANSKVTKMKFTHTLTETLGFSKDSISWNISQRAVQDIVSYHLKNTAKETLFSRVLKFFYSLLLGVCC